ncbi:Uncharacterised protein [Mycobacteroides abscessus]|nr:Uncharacterised protein [Mycobacteroides abscessus]
MAHIPGEDQRRYAEAHASAEPVNIYDPDGAASGQYFMAGRRLVRMKGGSKSRPAWAPISTHCRRLSDGGASQDPELVPNKRRRSAGEYNDNS